MNSRIRFSPISKSTPDNKPKSVQIIQPRARKSLVFLHQPQNIVSSKNSTMPEIVQPAFSAKSIHRETVTSKQIRSSLSDPNFLPLESLSPKKEKKNRISKRHRNSCSADISWSPNLAYQDDEIRQKKFENCEEDGEKNIFENNKPIFHQINTIPSENIESPLCNY